MKNLLVALLSVLAVLGAMVLTPQPGLAQTPFGTILGTVKDQTGAVVPGVTITVTNVLTNIQSTRITDDLGNYIIPSLPAGRYDVSAELARFRKETVKDLLLEVEKKARVDFVLTVGEATERVEVVAAAPLVDTDSSSVGTVVDTQKIVQMPLNGRNFLQLATLTPATLQPPVGLGLGVGNSIGGGRLSSTGLLLDGVDFSTLNTNSPNVSPFPDTIQEFKIQTTTMNAEAARPAVINLLTRSGTNRFHGSVYEFLRNDALNAKTFFTNRAGGKKTPFRFNQFGATSGGPIIRNRTFFFASYDGSRVRTTSTVLANLPSPQLLQGDFSAVAPGIKDPLTGQAFAGGRILPDRFSLFAKKFIPFIPPPNLAPGVIPGVNFALPTNNPSNSDNFSARVDHHAAKDLLWGRYQYQRSRSEPGGLTNLWSGIQFSRNHNLVVGENHTFSPNIVNEARFAYNSLFAFNGSRPALGTTNYAVDVLGLKNLTVTPGKFTFPTLVLSGFSNLGGPNFGSTLDQTARTYDFVDNVTLIAGAHTLKTGVAIRPDRFNLSTVSQNGALIFQGTFTGNSAADFLLGYPLIALAGMGAADELGASTHYNFFLQDDWKVSARLTLNYGLRYEYQSPVVNPNNKLSILDQSFPGGRILIAASPDYVVPGVGLIKGSGAPLVSRGMMDPDFNNFAPRFGFAFRPFSDNRTAIRGGYGVFYDQPIGNVRGASPHLPPFFFQQTLVSTDPAAPLRSDDLFIPPTTFASGGGGSESRTPRTPYLQQWSLNVQRELVPNFLLEAGYLGAKGTKLQMTRSVNQARLGSGSIQSRIPLANFQSGFFRFSNEASSSYHAFILKAEKRYSTGLSFLASYTWGKIIDTSPATVPPLGFTTIAQNDYCLRCERALGDIDARQRFVISYIYQLPFGRGKRFLGSTGAVVDRVVGGWEIVGITTFQSGSPVNVTVPGDNANVGAGAQRPDLRGPVSHMDFRETGFAFDTSPFARPAAGTFGSAGRNVVPGPGINNFDFGLYKNIFLDRERKRSVQFRAEMFNIFNHAQFTPPNGSFGTPQFGRFLGTRAARDIQLALKINF